MKHLKQSNKGFTLVEIIVSIAIFVAVLAVLGSVLISGFKYFYETSNTDLNKRSVDELQSYIRGELIYATDVFIQDTKPDDGDWYSFTIKDGHLKHYEEKQGQEANDLHVFDNNSFYNNNLLELHVKAYQNNRLDIKLTMYDSKEELYTTRDTLELLNLNEIGFSNQAFADGSYVGDYKGMTDSNSYKIYYKRSKVAISNGGNNDNNEDNNHGTTGTVADRINMITWSNNRGYFNFNNTSLLYNRGDYVYYEGDWWYKNGKEKSLNPDGNAAPNTNGSGWTKLSEEYALGEYSYYYKDDIVKYNGKYIKCVSNEPVISLNTPNINTNNPYNYQWVEISEEEASKKEYVNYYDGTQKTVVYKMPKDILPNDTERKSIDPWRENVTYNVGDYVRIPLKKEVYNNITGKWESIDLKYSQVYLKVFEGNGKDPGVSNQSGWQLLENDYFNTSSYQQNDYVIGNKGTKGGPYFIYFHFLRDNLTENTINEYVEYQKSLVEWDNTSQWKIDAVKNSKVDSGWIDISDNSHSFFIERIEK